MIDIITRRGMRYPHREPELPRDLQYDEPTREQPMTVKNVPPGGPVGPAALDALDALDGPDALDAPDALHALDALHGPDALDAPDALGALHGPDALDAVAATPALEHADPVAEIARALSAREIAPEQAVASLVEHSLDAQPSAALSAAERAGLRDELLGLIAEDPVLAGMVARLGAGRERST
jgi:hypothetical protein